MLKAMLGLANIKKPKTAEEFAKDITNTFPGLKDKTSLVEKFARMGALLEDEEQVLKLLGVLEEELSQEYKKILLERLKEAKQNQTGKYYHALRNVLDRQESIYGFNAAEGLFTKKPDPLTLTGIVPPEVFSNVLLKLGYHWKDPGAGVEHGEYTHRIQWYMFTKSSQSNGIHALEMFKAMGDPACCTEILDKDQKTQKLITMWDYIVDCFDGTAESVPASDSARAPNYLMQFMMRNRSKLSTLCAYLEKKEEKRLQEITMAAILREDELTKLAGPDIKGNALQVFKVQYLYAEKYAKKFGMKVEELKNAVGKANIYPPLKTM